MMSGAKFENLRTVCQFCDDFAETGRHDKSCVMRASSRPVETDDDNNDQLPFFEGD